MKKLEFSTFKKEALKENMLRSINGGDIYTSTSNDECDLGDWLSPQGDTYMMDADETRCDYCEEF